MNMKQFYLICKFDVCLHFEILNSPGMFVILPLTYIASLKLTQTRQNGYEIVPLVCSCIHNLLFVSILE